MSPPIFQEPGADPANPRLHNEVYPFIYPSKFKGTFEGKVVVITGMALRPFTNVSSL